MHKNFLKHIILIILLYTLISQKGYSGDINNILARSGISNLFPQNCSNSLLNEDSLFYILINSDYRKFENDKLSTGRLNICSPLIFHFINISFDFSGNFSNLYNNYSSGIGLISKITEHYRISAYYNFEKFDIKYLNNYNSSGINLGAAVDFDNIYPEIQLYFSNFFGGAGMNLQTIAADVGYKLNNNYHIDFEYCYDFRRKNIFGVSNKLLLNQILRLRAAYYVNPNRFIGGAAIDISRYLTFALNLDKSENLPYNIIFQLGAKL